MSGKSATIGAITAGGGELRGWLCGHGCALFTAVSTPPRRGFPLS